MNCMFSNCNNLTEIKFNDSFNTGNVTNMNRMFDGCSKLTKILIGGNSYDNIFDVPQFKKYHSFL